MNQKKLAFYSDYSEKLIDKYISYLKDLDCKGNVKYFDVPKIMDEIVLNFMEHLYPELTLMGASFIDFIYMGDVLLKSEHLIEYVGKKEKKYKNKKIYKIRRPEIAHEMVVF